MNHTRWHRGARLMVLARPPATPMRTTRDRWRSLADLDTGRLRWVDLGATYRGDAVPRRQGSVSAVLRGDWGGPSEDLSHLAPDLVSAVMVTDPFGDVDFATLDHCFDRVGRFKKHDVAELDRPPELFVSTSHRRSARRALRTVAVELCPVGQRLSVRSRHPARSGVAVDDEHRVTGRAPGFTLPRCHRSSVPSSVGGSRVISAP
jgi:hypothetical protein